MESNIKPKKRKFKVVRKIETYRAARRNEVRGTDQVALTFGEYPKVMRRSYVSKNQSKYMPHFYGKGYIETPERNRPYADVRKILESWQLLNNKKRNNSKRRAWKKRRSSGLH